MGPRILIVAYGNPLRSDDGVAWRAADALESKLDDRLEIIRVHQLTPELADAARNREMVVFIDAACVGDVENGCPGEVHVREISTDEIQQHSRGHFTHVYSPAKVLNLARQLYDATPKACVITVAGENFEHGERLSAPVANALPELIARIEQTVEGVLSKAENH
jgi:hydrogenase maturation protease